MFTKPAIKNLGVNSVSCDIQKCTAKKKILHVVFATENFKVNLTKNGTKSDVNKR